VLVQQFEQALEQLVLIIDLGPTYQNNSALQVMLKVFNLVGNGHPLIRQFRASLQRYSH